MPLAIEPFPKVWARKKKEAENARKKKAHAALKLLAASTPPMSSADTKVWYWELDGVPTTVMYTQDRNEVWCNGYILETVTWFDDCPATEGYIEFNICLDKTESVHNGRIHRRLENHDFFYQLVVNGCPILEHTVGATNSGPYSVPPSYNESEILSAISDQGDLPDYYCNNSMTTGHPQL